MKTPKEKLWEIFSQYIRLRDSDEKGYVNCVSCGKRMHYKESSAGHYIPKNKGLNIYFEEKNVHNQCSRCNIHLSGNLSFYALYLEKRYGKGILQELEEKRRKIIQIHEIEYNEKIKYYKEKVRELKKNKTLSIF